MRTISVLLVMLFLFVNLFAQVRNGWRSIYDTDGRLTRMQYFDSGIESIDSNLYFQYFTDNVIKGIVNGEMTKDEGCNNGAIYLFDESGDITSYNVKRDGQLVFNMTCNYFDSCYSVWSDKFDAVTGCWVGDSFFVKNGELVIPNDKTQGVAIFNPPVNVDLKSDFIFVTHIPNIHNSSKLGVVFDWKDESNFYLFEISFGEYFSLIHYDKGVFYQLNYGAGRQQIEKKNPDFNEIRIRGSGSNLIFEVNGNIELISARPKMENNNIGLMTRSRGDARFMDVAFQYVIPRSDLFYTDKWIGKGTGFFITSSGKILTTYDVVADAKNLRIKGILNGEQYILPVDVVRVEEEKNIAILQVRNHYFSPFKVLPYGFISRKPISDSHIFSIGYPNATSGIYMEPEEFKGRVMPASASVAENILLEMSFRYGMIGSPVFDNDVNLVGIVANKGMDIKYTEIVDFYSNSRLIAGYMNIPSQSVDSPLKDMTDQERLKALSESVVIIESSMFDLGK